MGVTIQTLLVVGDRPDPRVESSITSDPLAHSVALNRVAVCRQIFPEAVEFLARLCLEPASFRPLKITSERRADAEQFVRLSQQVDAALSLAAQIVTGPDAIDFCDKFIDPLLKEITLFAEQMQTRASDRLHELVDEARHVLAGQRPDGASKLYQVTADGTAASEGPTLTDLEALRTNAVQGLKERREWFKGRVGLLAAQRRIDSESYCPRRLAAFMSGSGVECDVSDLTPNFRMTEQFVLITTGMALTALSNAWRELGVQALRDQSPAAVAFLSRELGRGYPEIRMKCNETPGPPKAIEVIFHMELPREWITSRGTSGENIHPEMLGICVGDLRFSIGQFGPQLAGVTCRNFEPTCERGGTGQLEVRLIYPANLNSGLEPLCINSKEMAIQVDTARSVAGVCSVQAPYLVPLPSCPNSSAASPVSQSQSAQGLASRRSFEDPGDALLIQSSWPCLRCAPGVKGVLYYRDEVALYRSTPTTVVLLNPQYPSWLGGTSKSRAVLSSMVTSDALNSTHRISADVTLTLCQAGRPEIVALISNIMKACDLEADIRIFSVRAPRSLQAWGQKIEEQLVRLQTKFATGDTKWKVVLDGPIDDIGQDSPQTVRFAFLHPTLHVPVEANFDFRSGELTVLDRWPANLHRMPPFGDLLINAYIAAKSDSADGAVRTLGFLTALKRLGIEANNTLADGLVPLLNRFEDIGMRRNMVQGLLANALSEQRFVWAETAVGQYSANLMSAA